MKNNLKNTEVLGIFITILGSNYRQNEDFDLQDSYYGTKMLPSGVSINAGIFPEATSTLAGCG